jgi:hypothetical protein
MEYGGTMSTHSKKNEFGHIPSRNQIVNVLIIAFYASETRITNSILNFPGASNLSVGAR